MATRAKSSVAGNASRCPSAPAERSRSHPAANAATAASPHGTNRLIMEIPPRTFRFAQGTHRCHTPPTAMRITHHILASLCALLVAGCPRRARTRPEDVVQPTDAIGTSAPFFVLAAAPEGRWVVACQAREDSDGSGAIDARVREDGTFAGDDLVPYLFRSGPAGDAFG